MLLHFALSLSFSIPFLSCTPLLSDAGSCQCWAHTEICHRSFQLQRGATWAGPQKALLQAFPCPSLASWLKSVVSFPLSCHLPLLTLLRTVFLSFINQKAFALMRQGTQPLISLPERRGLTKFLLTQAWAWGKDMPSLLSMAF